MQQMPECFRPWTGGGRREHLRKGSMCQATYTFAKKEAMICGFVEFSVGGTGRIRPMHLERPAYEGMQED